MIFIYLCAVVLVSVLLRGFVLSTIWQWFLTPTFGIPAPGVSMCIGILLIISFLTPDATIKTRIVNGKIEGDQHSALLSQAIVAPLFTLLFSWIVTFFI